MTNFTLTLRQHTRLEDILNNKLPQIATISADLDTLQSHQSALQADVRSLRSGLTEVGGHVGDVRRDVEGMKKDIEGMREDVMEIEREGGVVREEMEGVQLELGNLKQDVGVMEIGVGRQADGEKQDTTAVPTDEDLRARIKEELRTLIAQDIELPSLARKRKHDDLEFDSNSGLPTPAVLPTSVTSDRLLRPRKRLRLVANCAAAGVVGALGAWLGLAFL
ncbi:hypothetical protein K439DRAFT_865516 [Ramaria rubella]|nr:hypothetical protein K439DRAFT_865516 [Ramaria rubella]